MNTWNDRYIQRNNVRGSVQREIVCSNLRFLISSFRLNERFVRFPSGSNYSLDSRYLYIFLYIRSFLCFVHFLKSRINNFWIFFLKQSNSYFWLLLRIFLLLIYSTLRRFKKKIKKKVWRRVVLNDACRAYITISIVSLGTIDNKRNVNVVKVQLLRYFSRPLDSHLHLGFSEKENLDADKAKNF